MRQLNPDKSERSVIDFDNITMGERLQMCLRATQTFFGSNLMILENAEIKPSKFYALYEREETEIDDCDMVQAIKCPTQPTVYIHVSKRESDGNILWVLVRINDLRDVSLL